MTKTGKIVAALIGVAVIAGGIWAVTAMTNKPINAPSNQSTTSGGETSQPPANGEATTTITFNGDSFEPATVTVKSGSTIKVVNNSLDVIEFASDPHPTHTINPELNTSDIEPSGSATITVTKTGSWGYHNHYDPSKRGTVTVE
jgi:plastocyanin